MMDPKEFDFNFPKRGFHLVVNKVAEADFFLEKLNKAHSYTPDFDFYLSAYVTASRSITFALQAVMADVPEFGSWYEIRQERLNGSELAKYFVKLRNHLQKVGEMPIERNGVFILGLNADQPTFVSTRDLKNPPTGNVLDCCRDYLRIVLSIISECYRDFWVYCDPRAFFSKKGLTQMGWSIEDLEEFLGFPRGFTDSSWEGDDKDEQRLKALARYGPDELLDEHLIKYQIKKLPRE